MDHERFELLAKLVAGSHSRRRAVRLIVGAVVAGFMSRRAETRAQNCGFAAESCEVLACCDGFACGPDLTCLVADLGAGCVPAGGSCAAEFCCEGLVCRSDLTCGGPEEVAAGCSNAGDSCATHFCCEGLVCRSDLTCGGPEGDLCALAGESCANAACCTGLACGPDLTCLVADLGVGCAQAGASCATEFCCEGLVCRADLTCGGPEAAQTCGFAGESCADRPCCEGLACGPNLSCLVADLGVGCAQAGSSCADQFCCEGLVCRSDLTCGGPEAAGAGCGNAGDSCAIRFCCEGLVCRADATCGGPEGGLCALAGESCANAACCTGLACGPDLTCLVADLGAGCAPAGGSCATEFCCEGLVCRADQTCGGPDESGQPDRNRPARATAAASETTPGDRNTTPAVAPGRLFAAEELGLPELAVSLTANGVRGPREITAGRYLLTFTNQTADAALLQLMLPPAEWSPKQIRSAVETFGDDAAAPEARRWFSTVELAGGAEASGNTVAQAIVDLIPGRWALVDWRAVKAADLAILTVNGDLPATLPAVREDAAVVAVATATGYEFVLDGTLRAGRQIVRVTNRSDEPHFITPFVGRESLAGAARAELEAIVAAGTSTIGAGKESANGLRQAPASGLVSSGATFWWLVDLTPGAYALVCFSPGRDGTPHSADDAITSFVVG